MKKNNQRKKQIQNVQTPKTLHTKSPQNPAPKKSWNYIAFEEATADEKRALAALGSAEALDEVLETLDQILSAEGQLGNFHPAVFLVGTKKHQKEAIKLTNLSL